MSEGTTAPLTSAPAATPTSAADRGVKPLPQFPGGGAAIPGAGTPSSRQPAAGATCASPQAVAFPGAGTPSSRQPSACDPASGEGHEGTSGAALATAPVCADHAGCLWDEFAAPLRSFLRARTRTPADAEDLLQEVFVRIQKRLPTLHDTSKIQGWVYRIARNAVIDHYRTRRDTVPMDFEVESEDPAGEAAVDLRPALRRFIADLPAAYREPLVRHEYQGESIEEVAAALGLTVTATKSRVRRARLMLRTMLDRCCRFEFDHRGRVIEATPKNPCEC